METIAAEYAATAAAEGQLRNVFVLASSYVRHAQKLLARIEFLHVHGVSIEYVPKPCDEDAPHDREMLARRRAALNPSLADLHVFADGCERIDGELRIALTAADTALRACARELDLSSTPVEERTTIKIRRALSELRQAVPSPVNAGWAAAADEAVLSRIETKMVALRAWISDLQLIATSQAVAEPDGSAPTQRPPHDRQQRASRPANASGTSGAASAPARSKRRRKKAIKLKGWVYLADASQQLGIPRATLQDWKNKLPSSDVGQDPESGQVRVRERALRKFVSRRNRESS